MKGLVGIRVSDEAIASLLAKRDVDGDALLSTIGSRDADLLQADLYVWCYTAPSTGQSVEDADGGWRHKEGGYSLTPRDKEAMLVMANSIYEKYGEAIVRVRRPIRIIRF
jgi:hypothetical protein